MEFRDISWANLVFVSVLNEERHREDIADIWNVDGSKLYTGEADKELQRLYEVQILSKDGEGFKAKLKSQSFRTELQSYLTAFRSEEFVDDILDNLGAFHRLIQDEKFRSKVFSIDNIRAFYNQDPLEAKENPLELFTLVAAGLAGKEEQVDTHHSPDPILDAVKEFRNENHVEIF